MPAEVVTARPRLIPSGSGMKVAGLVLAAGGGSRFGQPKAAVEVGGRRLVDRAIESCVRAGLSPVVVVLGAAWLTPMPLADEVAAEPADIWLVENARWPTGIASSLRAGIGALESDPGIDALVITLVDTISVGQEHLRRVGSALRGGATVAVATYGGHARTPVGLAREHWADVARTVAGDEGARVWLRAHPDLVTNVECGDLGALIDIDTPDDLPR